MLEFSTNEVAKASGLTLRKLQWWSEHQIVCPVILGHCRVWDFQDMMEVLILQELNQKGLSLERLRKIIPKLRRELKPPYQGYVFTDGRVIAIEKDEQFILLMAAKHPRALYIVDIRAQRAKVNV